MNDQDFRLPISTVRKDVQPLVLNSNSHPGYMPVKLNVKTAHDMKLSKSKAPEKPLAPYMRYSKKVWDSVKAQHPEAKLWELGKIIGQMWKDMSDVDKQEYIGDYENAKADYCEQLKMYHNSPQYQGFLSNTAKKRVKGQYEDGKSGGNVNSNGMMGANILNTLNNSQRLAGISDAAMSHYAIEPAEDESIEETASARQVAQARFNRNHRLLNDIFNEYTVADNRSIITSQRMEQLKKQVNSLELHQNKLKQELQLIEDKFEMKKKRILESSDEFQNEIDKLNKFKIDEEELKKFYTKHYEQLQKQWKEQVERLPRNENFNHEIEMLKMSIENIVSNNKALLTIPAASSVSLVALQQVIEVAPSPAPASVAPVTPAQQPPTPTPQQMNPQQQPPPPPGGAALPQSSQAGMQFPAGHHPQTLPNQQMYHQQQQMLHHHHQQQQQQQQQHMMHPGAQHNVQQQAHHMQQPHHVPPVVAPPPVAGQQHQNQQAHMGGPAPPATQPPHNLMQQQAPPGAPQPAPTGEYPSGYNPNQLNHQAYPQVYPQQQQHQQQQPPLDINQQQQQNPMYPGMTPQIYSAQHHQQYGMQQQQQYQMQQQQQQQRGVPGNPGFIPPSPVINQQGTRFNAPPAATSQPPMQPNQSQMMGMNRPPLPGVQQAPPNMSANPQVPNPTQMPGNQVPNNQVPNPAYSNFMMTQPQFNQQQQYRSTNTPPTNTTNTPTSMISPPQQQQQQAPATSAGSMPPINNGLIGQPPMHPQQLVGIPAPAPTSTAPNPANTNQPGVRLPPQQQTVQQTMPSGQIRHPNQQPQPQQQQQQPAPPANMGYYNPQMPMGNPSQPHMYNMPQQQQQQHYNMMAQHQQQQQQQQPNQYLGAPMAGQQAPQQGQMPPGQPQYGMNPNQPLINPQMQPGHIQGANMMYPGPQQQQQQHQPNMMYSMPNGMNPQQQQAMMMQQQQQQQQHQQMLNSQYGMYQNQPPGAPPSISGGPQQQPPPVQPPAQPAQLNTSSPSQAQQPQQAAPPAQPAETKTKGKKKEKKSKAASGSSETS